MCQVGIFWLFLVIFNPCFSVFPLPACYLDGQKCGLEGNNLENTITNVDISQCREECQNSGPCTVFTYFGSNSSPFQRTCLLLSSCSNFYPCVDCVTESVEDCLCSLPYQCYFNDDNIHGIIEGIPYEEACRRICYDTGNCTTYTYYDEFNLESPRLCVLLKECKIISPEHCLGCHTGPQTCTSSAGGECQFAIWSNMETGMMITEDKTVRLLSGEPDCYKEVRGFAIGGGGGTVSYRAGGGSGFASMLVTNLSAHVDLQVVVGVGGMMGTQATPSIVTSLNEILIEGAPGISATSSEGGNGYSGGGAQGANGGNNGMDGDTIGDFLGGYGSRIDISTFKFDLFQLSPGNGGSGEPSTGGGGGGGIRIDGESPTHNDYHGEGFGGGAGGFDDTNGLQGCVILEV